MTLHPFSSTVSQAAYYRLSTEAVLSPAVGEAATDFTLGLVFEDETVIRINYVRECLKQTDVDWKEFPKARNASLNQQ